uniref:Uncharacterized protein n=1 Tax=Schistocephalus solidus TaxID=70667 RepID=A0A0V0JAT8_SCHSO
MTHSTGSKAKLWLVETSPSDPDSKKFTERMGMTVTEFAANMGYGDREFRSKTGRIGFVWPKHTMREIRDPAEIVYQYGISDNSWSLRYKALGCHELPSLDLLRHRDNPKFSENSALFPQLAEPCATAPAQSSNIPTDALFNRTDQQPVADDITSEQRDRLLEDLRLSDSDEESTKTTKSDASPEHLSSPRTTLKVPVADAPQTAKSNPSVNNHKSSVVTSGVPMRIPNPSLPHQRVQGVGSTDLLGKSIILTTKPVLVSPLPLESSCNPTAPTTARLKHRGPEDSSVSPSAARSVDLSDSRLPLPDGKQSAAAGLRAAAGKLVSPPAVKILNSSTAGTLVTCKQRANCALVDSTQEQSNKENMVHSTSVGSIPNPVDGLDINSRSSPPPPPLSADGEKRTSSTAATSRTYVRQVLAKADAILDLRQQFNLLPSICAESLSFTDNDSELQMESGELDTSQQTDNDLDASKPLKGPSLRRKLPFGPCISPLPQSPINGEIPPSYSSPRLKAAAVSSQDSRSQIDSRIASSPLSLDDIPPSQIPVPSVQKDRRKKPSRTGLGPRNYHRHSTLSFNEETFAKFNSPKHSSERCSLKSNHAELDTRACVSSTEEVKLLPLSPKTQEGVDSLPKKSLQCDNKVGNESSPITSATATLSMPPPRSKQTRSERSSSSSTAAPSEAPTEEVAVAAKQSPTPTAGTDSPSLRSLPSAPWVLSAPLPSTDICSRLPRVLLRSARNNAASYEDKLSALRFVMRSLRVSSNTAASTTTPTIRPLTAVLLIPPTHPLDSTETGHSTEAATATSPSLLPPAPVIAPEVTDTAVQSETLTAASCTQVSPRPFICTSTCTSPSLAVQQATPEVTESCVGTSPLLFSHATAVCHSMEKLSLEDCLHRVLKHNQESVEATRRSFLESTAAKQLSEAEQLEDEATQCWNNLVDFVNATSTGNKTRTYSSSAAADKDLTKQFVCRCGNGTKTLLHYLFRLRDFTVYPEKMLSSARHFIAAAHLLEKTSVAEQKNSSAASNCSATMDGANAVSTVTGIYNQVVECLRTTANRLRRAEAKLLRRARTAAARIATELPNLPPAPGLSSPSQAGVSNLGAPEWSSLWYSALPRIASVIRYKEYQMHLQRTNSLREKIEADELLRGMNLDDDFLADSPSNSPLRVTSTKDFKSFNHDSAENSLCTLPITTVQHLLKFYRVATLAHEAVTSRTESETYLATDRYSTFNCALDSTSPAANSSPALFSNPTPPVFVAPTADISSLLAYIDGVLCQSRDLVAQLSHCPEALAQSAAATTAPPTAASAKRKRAAPSSDQSEQLAQSPPPPSLCQHHKRKKSKKPHTPRPPLSPAALPQTVIQQESVRKHKRFKSPSFSSSQPSAESVVSSSPVRSPPSAGLKSCVPSAEEATTAPRKSRSLKKMRVSEASEETDFITARDVVETSSVDYKEPLSIKRSKRSIEKDREASVSSVETERRQRSQRESIERMSDQSPQRSLTGRREGSDNGTFKASHHHHRSRSRSQARESRPSSKDDRVLLSPKKSDGKYTAGNNVGSASGAIRKHREKSVSRNRPVSKTDRESLPLPSPPSAHRSHRTSLPDPLGPNHKNVAERTSAVESCALPADESRLTYSPTRPYLSSNEAGATAAHRLTTVTPADHQYIPSAPKVDSQPAVSASQLSGRRTLLPGLPPKPTAKSQAPSFYTKWLNDDEVVKGDSKHRSIPTSHRSSTQRPHR